MVPSLNTGLDMTQGRAIASAMHLCTCAGDLTGNPAVFFAGLSCIQPVVVAAFFSMKSAESVVALYSDCEVRCGSPNSRSYSKLPDCSGQAQDTDLLLKLLKYFLLKRRPKSNM